MISWDVAIGQFQDQDCLEGKDTYLLNRKLWNTKNMWNITVFIFGSSAPWQLKDYFILTSRPQKLCRELTKGKSPCTCFDNTSFLIQNYLTLWWSSFPKKIFTFINLLNSKWGCRLHHVLYVFLNYYTCILLLKFKRRFREVSRPNTKSHISILDINQFCRLRESSVIP